MLLEILVRLVAGLIAVGALGAVLAFGREAVQDYRESGSPLGLILFAVIAANGLLSAAVALGGLSFLCAC